MLRQRISSSFMGLSFIGLALLAICFASGGLRDAVATEDLSKQVLLKDDDITRFIAAQPDIKAATKKFENAGNTETLEVKGVFDEIAKRHGFKDLDTLNVIAANIAAVLLGFDPETGTYVELREDLKKEIEEIKADENLGDEEKQRIVSELEKELAETPVIQYKENIALVKKHREAIEKALE